MQELNDARAALDFLLAVALSDKDNAATTYVLHFPHFKSVFSKSRRLKGSVMNGADCASQPFLSPVYKYSLTHSVGSMNRGDGITSSPQCGDKATSNEAGANETARTCREADLASQRPSVEQTPSASLE